MNFLKLGHRCWYTCLVLCIGILVSPPRQTTAAPSETKAADSAATLLAERQMEIETPDFAVKLVRSSQTVAALQPKTAPGFDFTPADWLEKRAANGFHHLGDLTLRLRQADEKTWHNYDTATARRPIIVLPVSGPVLAAADLSPSLPADCPLQITRSWTLNDAQRFGMRFEIKNISQQSVEIGALGFPMVFNNLITGRSLAQAHQICSFSDPSISQDAGYLQVTRLSGKGPALVVVPESQTPFEAYQPLDEPMPREQTFEGVLSWTVHSRAYAENEWRDAKPWNPPTSVTLEPGQSRTYALRFLVAPEIREIEKTLADNQRPVAVGIPGYVLPTDLDGRLFLNYGHAIKSITAEPADSIAIHQDQPTSGGWQAYTLRGQGWGRARLAITYEDGLQQSISYFVTKPAAEAVQNLGHFLMTKQWFVQPDDPFRRSPSVISYDREANRQLAQESRVWIAGLSDEGGAGSWLAAAMKEFGQPDPAEVAQYEQFVDQVLWGVVQNKDGPNRYGVRKSAFFYAPQSVPGFVYDPSLNWRSWTSWKPKDAADIGRGYNYPHVVAAYWAMYRLARNHPGMVKTHPWEWYLEQASQTIRFAFSRDANGQRRVGYVELGLMEGSVFLQVLEDLKHEGWKAQADEVETLMKERADRWKNEAYPFGSEMAWDSTGQEEVYAWCNYFGYADKARVTLDSITGYMPTIPHWGYNGNARRYWDFVYGGKLRRIERQLHHYGSGLNAIPILKQYRQQPDDLYLLRVGYGGVMGPLTNIDPDGFASAAFHSYPSTLKWDAYSGDYGPNFFGHALNTATYLVNHPEFGWQAFGGNVQRDGDWVRVTPRDSFRQRVYLATRGLWLTLDAGAFEAVVLNARTGAVWVGLTDLTGTTPLARLRLEQPAKVSGLKTYHPLRTLEVDHDAYSITLEPETTWIELQD